MKSKSDIKMSRGTRRMAAVIIRGFFLGAMLMAGFVTGLHATDAANPAAAAQPASAPVDRIFTEADALALLTTKLQGDYLKDKA